MIALTLKEIAEACDARLDGADPDAIATSVVIDSRAAVPGALFVALAGTRADGHGFVAAAHRAGAVAALVGEASGVHGSLLRVADPLTALSALARAVRERLRATTIAVTGSSGKTCTKDLTAAAVAAERNTVASVASYNNEIGVPLTVLAADEDTEVLIVEVGSRGAGHIAALTSVIRPDIAVVTNVGAAHAGMFGSAENTARAKAELVQALGADGIAVLNADDPVVRAMAAVAPGPVVTFGYASTADVRAEDVTLDDAARASFTLVAGTQCARVRLSLSGEHMVPNALAAAAAARAAGVSLEGIAAGLAECVGPAWRMEVRDAGGRRILNDSYNANPDSMTAALKALVRMARGRPSWAVLGPMAELGEESLMLHDRIGRLAVRLGVDNLVVIGEEARAMWEAARLEGMFSGEARFARDTDEAIELLRAGLEPDAVVLVKASRAAGLERVADALERDQ